MNSQMIAQVSRLLWLVFGGLSSPAYSFAGHIISISNGKPEFAMTDREMASVILPELDAESGERRIREWRRKLKEDQEAQGCSLITIKPGGRLGSLSVPTTYQIDFARIIASGERE